jgi:hypothetical protein
MAGTFPKPEFNSSYTITGSNLFRICDKKKFEKIMNAFLSNFHPGKTFKRP